MNSLESAFIAGYASLAAWSDLIDRINVFPVADSDTGANLRCSLTPLTTMQADRKKTADLLACSALGNSGNIGAAFFRHFVLVDSRADLPARAAAGQDAALAAVAEPLEGTMLSVFAALAELLSPSPPLPGTGLIREILGKAVLDGPNHLAALREAGVVDAGALAMFIFFDAFFLHLAGQQDTEIPIHDLFAGRLCVHSDFRPAGIGGICVNTVVTTDAATGMVEKNLAGLVDSLVLSPNGGQLTIHAHTNQLDKLHRQLAQLGRITRHHAEPIRESMPEPGTLFSDGTVVSILTDTSASLPHDLARQEHITLLDAWIIEGSRARPESLCDPAPIYQTLEKGDRVTTAQPPSEVRNRLLERLCREHTHIIYLCTGSAYTGNFAASCKRRKNDLKDRLTVLDTGAASGRLALIALLTARFARRIHDLKEIIDFARARMADCSEYVYIDRLRYLARSGRLSKGSGLLGDLLGIKLIISPTAEGVRKIGSARSPQDQLDHARTILDTLDPGRQPVILLQYSDNRPWIEATVLPLLRRMQPEAEILCLPLSLSSGVHMGPGTWSLALTPGI